MAITALLFLEYRSYQDLTVNLLELQAVYESYLLVSKGASSKQPSPAGGKFILVNRSAWNLQDLFCKDASKICVKSKPAAFKEPLNRKATFSWPLDKKSFWISSFFGPRKLGRSVRMHSGIDLAALKGTPVRAAAGGKVIEANYVSGYGNTIVMLHNRKYKTRYAHLDEIFVKVGQVIKRGQKIGAVGDTGFVQAEGGNASHLHFEVYAFDRQVNPILFLPKY